MLAGRADPAGDTGDDAGRDDDGGADTEPAGQPAPAADRAHEQVVEMAVGLLAAGGGHLAGRDERDECGRGEQGDPEIGGGAEPVAAQPGDRLLDAGRAAQKAKYFGELFPAQMEEDGSGQTFLDFFQINKTGKSKGIVRIHLRRWTT